MTPTTADEKNSDLDAKVLLGVLTAFRRSDFAQRMPDHWIGMPGKIADTLNEIIRWETTRCN